MFTKSVFKLFKYLKYFSLSRKFTCIEGLISARWQVNKGIQYHNLTCWELSPFPMLRESEGLSIGLQKNKNQSKFILLQPKPEK